MTNLIDAIQEINSLEYLKAIIENYGYKFEQDNEGYKTMCPFHNEKTPSFRLKDKGTKGAYYHCFGCNAHGDIANFIQNIDSVSLFEATKKAYEILGIPFKVKPSKIDSFLNFVETSNKTKPLELNNIKYKYENSYVYYDMENKPLYLKHKYRNTIDTSKKHFATKALIETTKTFKHGKTEDFDNTSKVIYKLQRVKASITKGNYIYFVEGEKDADNLNRLGFTVTTIYSKKWFKEYTEQLAGAKIVFIGDTGQAGEEFKTLVWNNLKNTVSQFKIVNLTGLEALGNNKDVTDWLEAGHTKEELLECVSRSLDLLNKHELQQDNLGIYATEFKKDKEGNITEIRTNYTDFRIIKADIYRNEDTKDQSIELTLLNSFNKKSSLKLDARQIFADARTFKKELGIDFTFLKDTKELNRFKMWVTRYYIEKDISEYEITGIRKINNEYALVTNNGTLYKDGTFNTNLKAPNNVHHNIDFSDIDILSKDEAQELAGYLFKFNDITNVYNTLGLGIANMLNSFIRLSPKDNLTMLHDIGESNSGKSKAMTILRLLFNNTSPAISYGATTRFVLLKNLNDTYLPVFMDEVKPSQSTPKKLSELSEIIRNITEGAMIQKGTQSQTLNNYQLKGSLILTGEEEIPETAVKTRENIVWYARNSFTDEGRKAIEFLCQSNKGKQNLRRLSKSLYLHVLNNYDEDKVTKMYDEVENKYQFNSLIDNSRIASTAIYTMMGLILIKDTLEGLGVDTASIINLNEAQICIVENIMENVLDDGINSSKAEYEIILEDIDHLAGISDLNYKLIPNVDYKELDNKYIALKVKDIYDRLTRYYRICKNQEVLPQKNFTKQLGKSSYTDGNVATDYYKNVKFEVVEQTRDGFKYLAKTKTQKAYLVKKSELAKLEISNLFDTETYKTEEKGLEELDNVIPF